MAYDNNKPADDGLIADAPQELRTNFEGLKNDQIVNAGTLNGLKSGNGQGQIPVSNGNVNTGLNADKLDGKDASEFANVQHNHSVATGSSDGFMSNTDKAKLDSIQAGAKVNQMAFNNVLVAGTTIQADSETDTLEMVAGANIALTPDAANDRVTIEVSGKVESAKVADYANTAGSAPANGGNAATANLLNVTAGNEVVIGEGYTANSNLYINFRDVKVGTYIFCNGTNNTGAFANITGANIYSNGKPVATADQIPTIPTSLPANGGNANTVGGYTPSQLTSMSVPSGVICMWSGSVANIPSGWALCNGEQGTPNLVDRFVLGAGKGYAIGATGGEATHILTIPEMPSHAHSYVYNNMSSSGRYTLNGGSGVQMMSTGSAGGGAAHNNMPPYYALAYIMKL